MSLSKITGNNISSTADITINSLTTSAGNVDTRLAAISGDPISEVDWWRITTSISNSLLTSANSERVTDPAFGVKGSGMSVDSSGVWTFPQTGMYHIITRGMLGNFGAAASNAYIACLATTDDFTTTDTLFKGYEYIPTGGGETHNLVLNGIVKCTDVSNIKLKFSLNAGYGQFSANTSDNGTTVTFIRLGDTP